MDTLLDRLCVWSDGEGNSGLPGELKIESVDDHIRLHIVREGVAFWTFIPSDSFEKAASKYNKTRGVTLVLDV